MIKVFGCSDEFMLKQQIYFYSNFVRRASVFSIKHINNFKNLFNIERDMYLIPRLQCYSVFVNCERNWKYFGYLRVKNMPIINCYDSLTEVNNRV